MIDVIAFWITTSTCVTHLSQNLLPQLPQTLPRTHNQHREGGPERILGSFGVAVLGKGRVKPRVTQRFNPGVPDPAHLAGLGYPTQEISGFLG